MAAKVFVDTNVLVCSRDASEAPKQAQTMAWMRHLWNARTGCLSYQVLPDKNGSRLQTFRKSDQSAPNPPIF